MKEMQTRREGLAGKKTAPAPQSVILLDFFSCDLFHISTGAITEERVSIDFEKVKYFPFY